MKRFGDGFKGNNGGVLISRCVDFCDVFCFSCGFGFSWAIEFIFLFNMSISSCYNNLIARVQILFLNTCSKYSPF